MIYLRLLLIFISLSFSNCSSGAGTGANKVVDELSLQSLPPVVDTDRLSIFIDKSDMLLSLLEGSDTLRQYPVVLGFDPVANKLREGDGATPEGKFSIRSKYPHKKWSYFLWIDYPTPESWKNHQAAKAQGKIASNAGIGGEIGIHGVPQGRDDLIDRKINWTLGCISLKNEHIAEIYQLVPEGAQVIIRP